MPEPTASLEGGPLSGAVIAPRSASVLVPGDQFDRPGEVARYRQTKRKDEDGLTVYAFKGWDRIVAQVAAPKSRSESRPGESTP